MEVYPKVKVREQELDDEEINGSKTLKSFDSLSLNVFSSSPVKETEYDTPTPAVRIHHSNHSNLSNSSITTIPVSKGTSKKINKNVVDEEKLNIRASPIPRPRAVLSSPDNDVMIRSTNKRSLEHTSALKNHNACQNKHHLHCKVTPLPVANEIPIKVKREPKANTDTKSKDIPQKRTTFRSQLKEWVS